MSLISATNYYFDPKYLSSDFTIKFPLASKYKEGFHVVKEYTICGNDRDPLNTIPVDLLKTFPNSKTMHIYTFVMEETLEWHKDSMILDAISRGKYTALIYGGGTLEVKNKEENEIERYEFIEKYRWVKFAHTNFHRFIPRGKTKMIMANTVALDQPFDLSLYCGTRVNNATYVELENESERIKLHKEIEEWSKLQR